MNVSVKRTHYVTLADMNTEVSVKRSITLCYTSRHEYRGISKEEHYIMLH